MAAVHTAFSARSGFFAPSPWPTIVAAAHKHSLGQPFVYPRNDLDYCSNMLNMFFAVPCEPYHVDPIAAEALALLDGGRIDAALIDVMLSFPTFFLILTVVAVLKPSIWNIMVVIGLTSWEGTARFVRAEILSLRERDFIQAAQGVGASAEAAWYDALRSALREDPDVVLIGEMRDLETIASAITIAETGHLVFATLHTNDASQSIDRIVDVFPPGQQGH